jgi:hypothetical protein
MNIFCHYGENWICNVKNYINIACFMHYLFTPKYINKCLSRRLVQPKKSSDKICIIERYLSKSKGHMKNY